MCWCSPCSKTLQENPAPRLMLDWWQVVELSKESNTGADGITKVTGSDKVAAAGKVMQQNILSGA